MTRKDVFSDWYSWKGKDTIYGRKFPGIYCIAISDTNISGQKFNWIREIKYIGMTNSKGGLQARLKQFDNTINWKEGHGGACRFRYKYPDYQSLIKKLFVSICYRECDVTSIYPNDLNIMGEVAKLEYTSFAEYVRRFNELPEFNDKEKSPKAPGSSLNNKKQPSL
jgi:hypothetical protein